MDFRFHSLLTLCRVCTIVSMDASENSHALQICTMTPGIRALCPVSAVEHKVVRLATDLPQGIRTLASELDIGVTQPFLVCR